MTSRGWGGLLEGRPGAYLDVLRARTYVRSPYPVTETAGEPQPNRLKQSDAAIARLDFGDWLQTEARYLA
jgi:hypothetical protein